MFSSSDPAMLVEPGLSYYLFRNGGWEAGIDTGLVEIYIIFFLSPDSA